jgi:poly(3-hydroxybutyrate) depolymerase
MKSRTVLKMAGVLAGAALSLSLALPQVQFAAAQQPGPASAGQAGPRGGRVIDPRVQQRTYKFTATDELPYALFVSSKVTKDKKNPLIVSLHGLSGNQNTMMTAKAVELAEEGGYILVTPMGYNSSGWYGAPSSMATGGIGAPAPAIGGGRGGARGGGAPGAGAPGAGGPGAGAPGGPGAGAPRGAGPGGGPGAGGGRGGGTTLGTPSETSQNSEKDVMNVLEMIRKEFNVDERRTYIMGHSMGGAGAMYLGVKYASNWAAIGAMAPATQPAGINPNNYSLEPAKNIPFIIVQGDMDTLVPHLTSTRPWIEKMKELNVTHQYIEVVGGDHGSVLTTGMTDIFAFFNKH